MIYLTTFVIITFYTGIVGSVLAISRNIDLPKITQRELLMIVP